MKSFLFLALPPNGNAKENGNSANTSTARRRNTGQEIHCLLMIGQSVSGGGAELKIKLTGSVRTEPEQDCSVGSGPSVSRGTGGPAG